MLTKEERETTINFNEAEPTASVEVPVRSRLYTRLLSLGLMPTQEHQYHGKVESVVFGVPKGWIKINAPRSLSADYKAKLSINARKNLGRKEKPGLESE